MRLYVFVCVRACVCIHAHVRSFVGEPFCVCVWLCVRGCVHINEQMHVSVCLVIFNCKDYKIILLSQYFTIATIYFDSILVISYFNTTTYYYGNILIRHYFTTTLLYILVQLLMSSRGFSLLIRIVIYQNVHLDE